MEEPKTKLEKQAFQIATDHYIAWYDRDTFLSAWNVYNRLREGERLQKHDDVFIEDWINHWEPDFISRMIKQLYSQIMYVFEDVNEDNLKNIGL